jgi:hypothetical protein
MRSPLAAACDDVPGTHVADPRTYQLDPSGGAIAQGGKSLEAVPYRGNRRANPLSTHLLENLTCLVRSTPCFSEQRLPSDLDLRALRAGTDEWGGGLNQHFPIIELWRRDIEHAKLSVLHPLRELLHLPAIAAPGRRQMTGAEQLGLTEGSPWRCLYFLGIAKHVRQIWTSPATDFAGGLDNSILASYGFQSRSHHTADSV